jgi:two-component system nitrogen regulation sensor histidine kinase NtrY
MTFRAKLFVFFTVAMLLSVALIAVGVSQVTRRSYDRLNDEHTSATVAQFQREFMRREKEVANRVQAIADAEATVRMAIDLARPQADVSIYVNDAHGLAQSHQLDFLDFVSSNGAIISSQESPEKFGYKMDWVAQPQNWTAIGSFLMKLDTQEGPALGLVAVSTVRVGDQNLFVVGGERLASDFLGSLVLPTGMRALLYQNIAADFQAANLLDASGTVTQSDRFAPIIQKERSRPSQESFKIKWTKDAASAEQFQSLPLFGRSGDLLAILFVGSSQNDVVMVVRRIGFLAFVVVAVGLIFGMLLSWWGAARVTRPIGELAEGAREVSQGNWRVHVNLRGRDEIAQLAEAFNAMTEQLSDQREKLVQAERVAAWREIARRLAHELKNPLFPLQTTLENLQRAKEQSPETFEEVFHESTGILLAEIQNLKSIVGKFSDFAKMPQPEIGSVNLNEVVRKAEKLFEAQFSAVGRPPINPEMHLAEDLPLIEADAMLLHRVIENLILNAMDAMPSGGVLMLRTAEHEDGVQFEISDTGKGLTPEECERLFTPYYTTKQHGSGLGLAIVQSVVSDHGGGIWVESEAGVGTSFHIYLPLKSPRNAGVIPEAVMTSVNISMPPEPPAAPPDVAESVEA